jgi:hypothetical protein
MRAPPGAECPVRRDTDGFQQIKTGAHSGYTSNVGSVDRLPSVTKRQLTAGQALIAAHTGSAKRGGPGPGPPRRNESTYGHGLAVEFLPVLCVVRPDCCNGVAVGVFHQLGGDRGGRAGHGWPPGSRLVGGPGRPRTRQGLPGPMHQPWAASSMTRSAWLPGRGRCRRVVEGLGDAGDCLHDPACGELADADEVGEDRVGHFVGELGRLGDLTHRLLGVEHRRACLALDLGHLGAQVVG